jgi:hypothetical protein
MPTPGFLSRHSIPVTLEGLIIYGVFVLSPYLSTVTLLDACLRRKNRTCFLMIAHLHPQFLSIWKIPIRSNKT